MKTSRTPKTAPGISDAEWEVMRTVWDGSPLSSNAIIDLLGQRSPPWHPKTVRTLLARLVRKKALRYEAEGRAYFYSPMIQEKDFLASASQSFLDRFFGGSLQPMLAHFVEQKNFSRAEIEKLRALLDGKKTTGGDK